MKARLLVFSIPCLFPATLATASSTLPPLTVSETIPAMAGVSQEQTTISQSTVTAEDIQRNQITRLDEVFQQIPGLSLSHTNGYGDQAQLRLRGAGARNVRVFIDGIEVSDTSRAQSQFYVSGMNMDDIESVDVLRGPQAGRFGADTGGGVINITTKRANAPFSGKSAVELGSYKTRRGQSMISGLSGPIDYRVSLHGENRGGYSDYNKRRGGTERDGYRQWGGAARLGLQATEEARVDSFVRYTREDRFYDSKTQDTFDSVDITSHQARLAGTHKTPSLGLTQVIAVSDSKTERAIVRGLPLPDAYKGQRSRLDYLGTWTLTPSANIQFGADLGRDSISLAEPNYSPSSPNTDVSMRKHGAFITLGVTPLDNLDFTASGRTDNQTYYGGDENWKLGAAYHIALTGTTVRGSYGTAWQTPSLYECYDACKGNPDLKSESLRGWDAGFQQHLNSGRVILSVDWFNNMIKDQISWSSKRGTRPGCTYSGGYDNTERVQTRGVETEFSWQLSSTLTAQGTYTWQISQNVLTGDPLLTLPPRHQATGALGWAITPALHAQTNLRYRDQASQFGERASEYWVADFKLGWVVNKSLRIHGRMENVLNRRYEEQYGRGTPGRSVFAGLTVQY
ncbi:MULTISPECIES: TonB-dependent receptor plug domain-containing protein [unclassified Haematospirillum]|uniref:TonB-dependent receptor plug domain-containing protein n=1 Tax=unclassified Haematospirillum TaxID=2622088 RepID=UPI00143A6E24|nr:MULTISPECIES: TonB-dependent receptor [unclassified Haematospirillum]NKD55879.1 TonB-dependent receptor [Haematospirillum sp. H4890]NKD75914.1 TonB-dependent receptor [Haematospirillum sp. H4485]